MNLAPVMTLAVFQMCTIDANIVDNQDDLDDSDSKNEILMILMTILIVYLAVADYSFLWKYYVLLNTSM